jgi:hypothetical protein
MGDNESAMAGQGNGCSDPVSGKASVASPSSAHQPVARWVTGNMQLPHCLMSSKMNQANNANRNITVF